MYEMLGNQYFLARNYKKATENLVLALDEQPRSKPIRRKLIICYTQLGLTEKAMDLFLSLIKEDAAFIINTDPVSDDCPCPELVYNIEAQIEENTDKKNLFIILGILWLYCDVNRSAHYFEDVLKLFPDDKKVKSVLSILSAKTDLINNKHTLTNLGGHV